MAVNSGDTEGRNDFAKSLSERLAAVIKEHYDEFAQQGTVELDSLRIEVQHLRGEVQRLNQELAALPVFVNSDNALQEATAVSPPHSRDGFTSGYLESPQRSSKELSSSRSFSQVSEPVSDPVRTLSMLTRHSTGFMDLDKKFAELAKDKGYIDVVKLADHMTQHLSSETEEKEHQVQRYRVAVHKLDNQLCLIDPRPAHEREATRGHIHLAAFQAIMTEDEATLNQQFEADVVESLLEIRDTLMNDVMVHTIAASLHVTEAELDNQQAQDRGRAKILLMLEPMTAVMILLSAVLAGFSIDINPDWAGWFAFEVVFCFFFLMELVLSVYARGCDEHFFGQDWAWTTFDFIIVCSALVDTLLTSLDKFGVLDMKDATSYPVLVLRLVRLIRVGRLLRILRLKMFKELTLMVNGVIASLRTILWAIVFLTLFMYVLGVFMRQMMNPTHNDFLLSCRLGPLETSSSCSRGAENMRLYRDILFGSVARSMLTMFSCFTDGCNSADGTPLIWHLWDTRGPIIVLVYVGSFMFISFGVLNLIMAICVENTLQSAMQHDSDRQFGQHSEHVRKARELYLLLGKLCKGGNDAASHKRSTLKRVIEKYQKSRGRSSYREMPSIPHLSLQISQAHFEDMMRDRQVDELMDDLDISNISRRQLFDILDSDGDGFLSISELVDGIMKLRGPADKGDVVAVALCMRQLQKQVSKFDSYFRSHTKVVDNVCKQMISPEPELTEVVGI